MLKLTSTISKKYIWLYFDSNTSKIFYNESTCCTIIGIIFQRFIYQEESFVKLTVAKKMSLPEICMNLLEIRSDRERYEHVINETIDKLLFMEIDVSGSMNNESAQQICVFFDSIFSINLDESILSKTLLMAAIILEFSDRTNQYFLNGNGFPAVLRILGNSKHSLCIESCFRIINSIAKTEKPVFYEMIQLNEVFSKIQMLGIVEQRSSLKTIESIIRYNKGKYQKNEVSGLISHFNTIMSNSTDEQVSQYCLTTSLFLLFDYGFSESNSLIKRAYQFLNTTVNIKTINDTLSTLIQLGQKKGFSVVLCQNITYLDVQRLLNSKISEKVAKITIRFLLSLLPNVQIASLFKSFCWNKKPKSCQKDIGNVFSIITPFIMNESSIKKIEYHLWVQTLSIIVFHNHIPITKDIISIMAKELDSETCAYCLLVLCNTSNLDECIDAGFIFQLSMIEPDPTSVQWYKENIKMLSEKCTKFSSSPRVNFDDPHFIENVCTYISESPSNIFLVFFTEIIDRLIEVIDSSVESRLLNFLSLQTEVIFKNYTISKNSDKFSLQSFIDDERRFQIITSGNKKIIKTRFSLGHSFLHVEGLINMNSQGVSYHDIREKLVQNPEIAMILNDQYTSETFYALFSRMIDDQSYQRYDFRINGRFFNVCDAIFVATSIALDSSESFKSPIVIEAIPSSMTNINSFYTDGYPDIPTPVRKAIYLLQKIKIADQKINTIPKVLLGKLDHQKSYSYLNFGLKSEYSYFMFEFPFLFPISQRINMFNSFYNTRSLTNKQIESAFAEESSNIIKYIQFFEFNVDRNQIFSNGCDLFGKYGIGPTEFKFRFQNEAGFGKGPTHEFFSIFAEELSKQKSNLWRHGNEIELFPSPTADPKLLFILGIFIGKIIIQGQTVDFPVSPFLFDVVFQKNVLLQNVDHSLHLRFLDPSSLVDLEYIYFGYEQSFQSSHSTINSSNVDEYISCIKDFTCGESFYKLMTPFIEGLNSVINIRLLKLLFSGDDIVRLINGDSVMLSEDELYKNLFADHGYKKSQKIIKDFASIVASLDSLHQKLFIQFVTGSTRLPIGGISKLDPPLTIVKASIDNGKNPDSYLPSVSTCRNYFKLPNYSSELIMRERIITAITEGCRCFSFS